MAQSNEIVFQEDEQELVEVDSRWTLDELLGKEGIFFLKDIIKVLHVLDPMHVKKQARALLQDGQSPWQVMGVRKVWSHWIVRMKVFGPYYREHLVPITRTIESHWDGNMLVRQKGIFLLAKVCSILPFSTNQLRYQAKLNPNAKEEYGVWKEEKLGAFVVDMEKFGPWVTKLWTGDHRKKR